LVAARRRTPDRQSLDAPSRQPLAPSASNRYGKGRRREEEEEEEKVRKLFNVYLDYLCFTFSRLFWYCV
jgi:hypothetical protein